MRNQDRWPRRWPESRWGTEYHAPPGEEVIEVALEAGDLLIFDSHLPHGTVRNDEDVPRAVFYLSMFPAGGAAEAAEQIAAHQTGRAPAWWAWKPGHDRVEPGPPAVLDDLGRRLIGLDPW
jgi:ectoine hydroxylase-related dioxygenase (phytanoyl-CoA dioxygenase family)